jgi:signal transduction histidine kinase
MNHTPYSVLIVDDSLEDRATYKRWLLAAKDKSYTVHEAATAKDGFRICGAEALHCILLDYNLPDMNGIDFLTALRESLLDATPAVVMLTGRGNEAVAASAIKAGAHDYLVKGLQGLEVANAVHAAIENSILKRRISIQEKELLLQSRELALNDRRKDEFLAALAHELRNPLAPIRTSVELLVRKFPAEPIVANVGAVVRRQIDHLTRLLDDLLDIARINSGKIVLQCKDVLLSEVITRVCDQCLPLVEKASHALAIEQPKETVTFHVDPVRLVQTLVNIVSNACKFSPVAGVISLKVVATGHEIVFRVKDGGIGLEPDSLERIFGMFAQSGSVASNKSGLGVGLGLAKQFAEMHGGSVTAQSEGLGRGSEFILKIPIKPADGELPPGGGIEPVLAAGEKGDLSKKRVLVVDDNRDSADTLMSLFEWEGHTVTVAYGGNEAVGAAITFAPDIIFMDIGMPGTNGYDAVRQIRQGHAAGRYIYVVAISGWGDEETRRRAKDAGFDHHLVKPFDFTAAMDLLKMVA